MAMPEVAELPIMMTRAVKVVLICDLICYQSVIYCLHDIKGRPMLGGLGGIPYMVEVNDIEGVISTGKGY
jgi:hypothetical protein